MSLRQDLEKFSNNIVEAYISNNGNNQTENTSLDDYIADVVLEKDLNDDTTMHLLGIANKTYLKKTGSTEFNVATLDGVYESISKKRDPQQIKVAKYEYPEYSYLPSLNVPTIENVVDLNKTKTAFLNDNISLVKQILVKAAKDDSIEINQKVHNLTCDFKNKYASISEDLEYIRRFGVTKLDIQNEIYKKASVKDISNQTKLIDELFNDTGHIPHDLIGRHYDNDSLSKIASSINDLTVVLIDLNLAQKEADHLNNVYFEIEKSEV